MKTLTIFLALTLAASVASAQKLPDTTHLKLTPSQVIAISAKVDSLQMLLSATSSLPSNQISAFNSRVAVAFAVLWLQVNKQIVKQDTSKRTK